MIGSLKSRAVRFASIAIALVVAFFGSSPTLAAGVRLPPASIYTYDGVIYDRLFSVLQAPPARRAMPTASDLRPRAVTSSPYSIVDLEAALYTRSGFSTGGYPTAVNDAGRITYYGECFCDSTGMYGNLGYIIDAKGDLDAELLPICCPSPSDIPNVIPYAINRNGYSAGSYTSDGGMDYLTGMTVWDSSGNFVFDDDYGGPSPGDFALAINEKNEAVGQARTNGIPYAAEFTSKNGFMIIPLLPPKNTSWIGTATAIDDAGEIVGYATFPNGSGGRAVRFYKDRPAAVLPVGAAGVSTSAQAINIHGHVVGNAGSRAFLYRDNRVMYLPRPPGEQAGNAVAYAINADDAVVGDIVTSAGRTAFLYVDGKSYDLTSLLPASSGWQISHAAGINDNGEIVGSGNEGSYSMKPSARTSGAMRRVLRF